MTIETLVAQGQTQAHPGLAALDTARLKAMRNASLRECFQRIEDTPYRNEFVARILGREYINDAASRSVGATWYALERIQQGAIWITCGVDAPVDYSSLTGIAMRKVRMLLVLGPDATIRQAFQGIVPTIVSCRSMGEALHKAYMYETTDVSVLFSPATQDGTPTEALGEAFRYEVNEL